VFDALNLEAASDDLPQESASGEYNPGKRPVKGILRKHTPVMGAVRRTSSTATEHISGSESDALWTVASSDEDSSSGSNGLQGRWSDSQSDDRFEASLRAEQSE
jgi:hypothetical protein